MDRSEPSLVPEWLRSTGSVTGVGSSAHHSALSSLHSDAPSLANHTRSKSSKGTGDYESPRSVFLERTSSSNSRRSSSSNGSTRHPYSSFSRSHRDKDRDKEKERLFLLDHWDRDCSDPVASIIGGRGQKDLLRRSRSMISGKQSDVLSQKVMNDLKNSRKRGDSNSNGVISSGSVVSSIQKATFEKDFPSLGAEEKQAVPDIRRVSSPGLSTAVQCLPISNSSVIGGEGWTSALAEVPSLVGSNGNGSSSVQQTAAATPVHGPPSTIAGLNMAEAVAQAPARARTAPQLSVQTQRLEELALKQSRQLIPMTPSMSKVSALNSSDKAKPKVAARTSEVVLSGKSGQQQFSQLSVGSQSLRGIRTDASKTSHVGKFLVLKPVRENGGSTPKEASSPTSNAIGGGANAQLPATLVATSAPLRNSTNAKSVERKTTPLSLNTVSTVDKRPPSAQAQSRNDFFNLMRKKSSMNHSSSIKDSGSADSSSVTEKSVEEVEGVASVPVGPHSTSNGGEVNSNGNTCENIGKFSDCMESNMSPAEEDEETRFLRSLGWEENAGEDEGLTEEEINSFIEEYMKHKPSLKLRRGLSSTNSKTEA